MGFLSPALTILLAWTKHCKGGRKEEGELYNLAPIWSHLITQMTVSLNLFSSSIIPLPSPFLPETVFPLPPSLLIASNPTLADSGSQIGQHTGPAWSSFYWCNGDSTSGQPNRICTVAGTVLKETHSPILRTYHRHHITTRCHKCSVKHNCGPQL